MCHLSIHFLRLAAVARLRAETCLRIEVLRHAGAPFGLPAGQAGVQARYLRRMSFLVSTNEPACPPENVWADTR
jgi:hypothetical protein